MNTLACPGCESQLAENQVKLKLTKDKKGAKARCIICHHAWKVPLDTLSGPVQDRLLSEVVTA